MIKPELLLPAGNLEKLRFALIYGADAVYIGGKVLSLRAQASNFTISDIKEATIFAHSLNKKIYVTVNVIPREKEIGLILDYLKTLDSIGIDGIIVSSPSIIKIAKDNTKLHVSLSTQASSMNSYSVNFYQENGLDRIVLARELTIDEIKRINENTKIETEVFIHGGMCSAISGRCILSNVMSARDANGGGCAHSCRWNYYLNSKGNTEKYFLKIGSKDLVAIPFIKDLMNANVKSLKVEGRMKSVSYVASVAYAYRKLIDDIYNGEEKEPDYYQALLGESMNREASTGFLEEKAGLEQTLYDDSNVEVNQSFLGIVKSFDSKTNLAVFETRNRFSINDRIEVISPGKERKEIFISYLTERGLKIEKVKYVLENVTFKCDTILKENDILRRISS